MRCDAASICDSAGKGNLKFGFPTEISAKGCFYLKFRLKFESGHCLEVIFCPSLPQSLVARETTGKDFLILRHFSLLKSEYFESESVSAKGWQLCMICKSNLSMNNELLLILMSCSNRALFLNRSYRVQSISDQFLDVSV